MLDSPTVLVNGGLLVMMLPHAPAQILSVCMSTRRRLHHSQAPLSISVAGTKPNSVHRRRAAIPSASPLCRGKIQSSSRLPAGAFKGVQFAQHRAVKSKMQAGRACVGTGFARLQQVNFNKAAFTLG
jgi:hypothetical protein